MYNNEIMAPIQHARLKCQANGRKLYLHVDVVKEAPISLLSGRACEVFELMQIDNNVVLQHHRREPNKRKSIDRLQRCVQRPKRSRTISHANKQECSSNRQNNARRIPAPLKEEVQTKTEAAEDGWHNKIIFKK